MGLRKLGYGLLSLLACCSIVACGRGNLSVSNGQAGGQSDNCRTIEHDSGQTKICDRPEDIATLGLHSLDLLLSLDREPAGVVTPQPVETDRVEQPEFAIPTLGERLASQPVALGSFATPASLEALVQLKPDAIVGEAHRLPSPLLSQIAPVLPLARRSDTGNWRENLRLSAKMLGNVDLADAAIADYQAQLELTRRELAETIATHPKVLVLSGDNLTRGILFALTEQSFVGELLTAVGFELVVPRGAERNSVPVSIELLPELNEADSIVILGYSIETLRAGASQSDREAFFKSQFEKIRSDWERNPLAQSLAASQADRVYFQTFYEWNILNGPIGAELVLRRLRETLGDS